MASTKKELIRHLEWALNQIDELAECDKDGTPKHPCDFDYHPDEAYCKFHHMYWGARGLIASRLTKYAPDVASAASAEPDSGLESVPAIGPILVTKSGNK